MTRTTLKIRGMTCGHCVASVREALEGVEGVSAARVDLEGGQAVVEYDDVKTDPRELAVAVADAGYESEAAA